MATHGLWFWLLINLGHDQQFRQRLSKRSSAKDSQQCPSQKPQDFNSFLWIMKRNPPVYFFGTIHVPYTKVWDYIPSNSKKAFEYTQNIYFELDLTDPVTRSTLARCQILPNGIMLREVIPRTLYKRIRRHLSYIRKMMSVWMTIPWEQRLVGFSPKYIFKGLTRNWYRKRPIWIMLLLNALTEDDIKAKGRGISVLDTFLILEANSQRKKTGSIESVEDQCRPLNAVNNSQVILALNQTLVLHERIRRGKSKLKYSTNDLIYHYNCGDLNDVLFKQDMPSLGNLQNASFSNSFEIEQTRKFEEYLKEELVYKRNKRMSKRIARLIQKKPRESFFFAFGAAHFLGNRSIIDILQKKGYKISHVHPEASLPRYGPERKKKKNKNKKTKIRRKHRFYIRQRQRRRHSIDNPRITFSSHETVVTTPGTVRLPTIQKVNSLLARPSSSSPSINTGQWLWFIFLILSFTTAMFKW